MTLRSSLYFCQLIVESIKRDQCKENMQFQIRTNLKFNLGFQISVTAVNIFGSNHIQIIDITLFIIYFPFVFVLELFTALFLKGGLDLLVYLHVQRGGIVFMSFGLQAFT